MSDKRLYPNTVIFKGTDDNEITYINERVLEQIRDEIQKVINAERDFTSENARAQAIALNWCLDIIDKYKAQIE